MFWSVRIGPAQLGKYFMSTAQTQTSDFAIQSVTALSMFNDLVMRIYLMSYLRVAESRLMSPYFELVVLLFEKVYMTLSDLMGSGGS